MLKKVYIEITNSCNLNCDFCIQNKSEKRFLNEEEFKIILKKLKGYTNYLYFHILGEPLLHPNIKKFINLAYQNNYKINITTNGYLIKKIESVSNIRQINISLHSYDIRYGISIEEYMENIFSVVDKMNDTYISYRLWVKNKYNDEIIRILNNHYNTNIKEKKKISNNIFFSEFHEFIWPDLDNNYYNEIGTCYALKDHIGILSNGNVIPCCLDSKGIITLGNIYNDDLNDILKSSRVENMKKGFNNNYKCEELCKHCSFIKKN